MEFLSCEQTFLKAKRQLQALIASFDDADSLESNSRIKSYLNGNVSLIDGLADDEDKSDIGDQFRACFNKLTQLRPGRDVQCIVLLFNRTWGHVFINVYSRIDGHTLEAEEIDLGALSDDIVAGDLGPIELENYEMLSQDLLYNTELEGCDLTSMNDRLQELLILKAFQFFEQCLQQAIDPSFMEGLNPVYPIVFNIQEMNGGLANRLTIDLPSSQTEKN